MQFAHAIQKAECAVRDRSTVVHPGKWQSVDVSNKPEMATHEVLNYTLQVPVTTESLRELGADIKPNLPWADDHFEERVSGKPLNPGKEWAHWPWGNSADKFRVDPGIQLSDRDWSYLAGMIDGDGSISWLKKDYEEKGRPRVAISQKDHAFIYELGRRYPFGKVSVRKERDTYVNERHYRSDAATWFVSGKAKTLAVLQGIEPYLIFKREKAQQAIAILESRPAHHSDRKFDTGERIFHHSYMERMWPKLAGGALVPRKGIRYEYGDAMDVVNHLAAEPLSRQAYLPIWGFEDTGKLDVRVPCTLGYHFIQRHSYFHCTYYIRSCDLMRHFRDDIYLTVRLQLWMLNKLRDLDDHWRSVRPGIFTMHIVSLHLFRNDFRVMFQS